MIADDVARLLAGERPHALRQPGGAAVSTSSDQSARTARSVDEVRCRGAARPHRPRCTPGAWSRARPATCRAGCDDGTVVLTPSSLVVRGDDPRRPRAVDLDGDVVAGERIADDREGAAPRVLQAYPEVGGRRPLPRAGTRRCSPSRTQPIPAAIDEFVIYIGGDVPVCDYQPAARDELASEVASQLGDRSAALMANHGMVCVGKSVDDALHSALVVEHNAQIMWGAQALGEVVDLPEKARTDFANVYDFVRHHMWDAEDTLRGRQRRGQRQGDGCGGDGSWAGWQQEPSWRRRSWRRRSRTPTRPSRRQQIAAMPVARTSAGRRTGCWVGSIR